MSAHYDPTKFWSYLDDLNQRLENGTFGKSFVCFFLRTYLVVLVVDLEHRGHEWVKVYLCIVHRHIG